jgi:hypothetical protein
MAAASPDEDPVRDAVLKAYDVAEANGLPRLDCYRAAIAAWQRRHPGATSNEASTAAVAIVVDGRLYRDMFNGSSARE